MSTVNLTADTFEAAVTDNDIVLVDWWAEWCGPCKMFGPVFEKASVQHADVVFGKVDTEDQQGLASGAGITSIPTLMAFKEGVLVFRQAGALPSRDLESVISQIKALDMADVRAKMAEQQAQKA
ncbi:MULTISPECIES: thioredoxin [unclassified Ornithinimicrobium]|uniref:thioredoxin n=1 Tax=unclassified Ornithinimicrobium TaxID=2615080 RepID=UPI003854F492